MLIEISTEAARKIGGIYTVISSKLPYLQKKYKEDLLLISMLDEKSEIDEKPAGKLKPVFSKLSALGIKCKYGEWSGYGAKVIAIDAREFGERPAAYVDESGRTVNDKQANCIKYKLWKEFKIDSLESSWDFNEAVVWGHAVGILIEELINAKIIASPTLQFHEWLTGAALLHLKSKGISLPTVFTTHATVLGRSLASTGRDVLREAAEKKEGINISESYRYHVEAKHQLEVQTALNADVLTCVSKAVATEVQYILGRKPDVIVWNGVAKPPAVSEERKKRAHFIRDELLRFLESYFQPYYDQSYKDAILTYISGRYEFSNKGFDIYINALGRLNKQLKKVKSEKRIFAFIFAASSTSGPRDEVIHNYLLQNKVNHFLRTYTESIYEKYGNTPNAIAVLKAKNKSVGTNLQSMLKGMMKLGSAPAISTHNLNYGNDIILNTCRAAGLNNAKDDRVKIIFYPTYASPMDGVLNMAYYDVLKGTDIGIFPSRYEPYGYTPIESCFAKNISFTTDASGLGLYALENIPQASRMGLKILKVQRRKTQQTVDELARELLALYKMPADRFRQLEQEAAKVINYCTWDKTIWYYFKAYQMAEQKHGNEYSKG